MNSAPRIILVAVTRGGLDHARLLRTRLRSGELYRPARHGPPEHVWEHAFDGPLSEQVPVFFAGCDQLVFFLAVGAVTRLIAPCLASKETDPGVLAVDEGSRFVIPLLSGHRGGANAFARTVAGCLGAVPVITTASDVLGGLSPDLLEETFGWRAEPAERLKSVALSLVNREPVAIVQEVGEPGTWLDERELPDHATFLRRSGFQPDSASGQVGNLTYEGSPFAAVLWITDRRVTELHVLAPERILWYRPRSLVLGVGCERGISREALEDGLEQFLQAHHYALNSIAVLATAQVKADEPALLEWAAAHGWRTVFHSAEELAAVEHIPNPSSVVERCVGTPGVAEPAALLAAGAERLLVEKQVVTSPHSPRRMTFALARLASFHERPTQGRVTFIGAGPGDPDLLTCKAVRALQRASVVVYAGSLVPEEVLRQVPATATLHNSAFLTLEQVMEVMLSAVRAGQHVVRLHSGDTSLYSAVQEQVVLLDEAGVPHDVIPGISSFQAVAAALGGELTLPEVVQTVILTRAEGLTPMPPGESLESLARHGATLCIFLSARLSETVQQQLLTAYPPETPVAIAHRITWPDELLVVTTLAHLHETVREHELTRTTLILVGPAVGVRRNRSRLYDRKHGHIFRGRGRDERPAAERHL
jgi:precorrin-4 C11-methyltransferase